MSKISGFKQVPSYMRLFIGFVLKTLTLESKVVILVYDHSSKQTSIGYPPSITWLDIVTKASKKPVIHTMFETEPNQ